MSASFKDLKSALDKIQYDNQETLLHFDSVFNEFVQNNETEIDQSLFLIEEFLINSLESSNSLKKVS